MTDDGTKLLYTIPEVATALALSKSKVWQMLADGELHKVKIGASARVTRAELERFLSDREREAGRGTVTWREDLVDDRAHD